MNMLKLDVNLKEVPRRKRKVQLEARCTTVTTDISISMKIF